MRHVNPTFVGRTMCLIVALIALSGCLSKINCDASSSYQVEGQCSYQWIGSSPKKPVGNTE